MLTFIIWTSPAWLKVLRVRLGLVTVKVTGVKHKNFMDKGRVTREKGSGY